MSPATVIDNLVTLGDLEAALQDVGIDLSCVPTSPGPRLTATKRADRSAALVMVVTTYSTDESGHKYIDQETGEAATETRRFFMTGDLRLVPCT